MGTAAADCACAEIGRTRKTSDLRRELPPSFRSDLGSLGLPGSQEKVAGRRTHAQGVLGHVVAGLPRPYAREPLIL